MPFVEKPGGSTRIDIGVDADPTPDEKGHGNKQKRKFQSPRHLQHRFLFLQRTTENETSDPDQLPREEVKWTEMNEGDILRAFNQIVLDAKLGNEPNSDATQDYFLPAPLVAGPKSERSEKGEYYVHRQNV